MPPPRFTQGDLKPHDVQFSYGSIDGLLWPVLERVFDTPLDYETNQKAIEQRQALLEKHHIGICDIVVSAKREKVDASDLGMQNVELRDLVKYLEGYPNVNMLLFTGGNSKNGPEYFMRMLLKRYKIQYKVIEAQVPRIHEFKLPQSGRVIRTVSLTSPSGSANRAIGSIQFYKEMKKRDPKFNTLDFRVLQYSNFFK